MIWWPALVTPSQVAHADFPVTVLGASAFSARAKPAQTARQSIPTINPNSCERFITNLLLRACESATRRQSTLIAPNRRGLEGNAFVFEYRHNKQGIKSIPKLGGHF